MSAQVQDLDAKVKIAVYVIGQLVAKIGALEGKIGVLSEEDAAVLAANLATLDDAIVLANSKLA